MAGKGDRNGAAPGGEGGTAEAADAWLASVFERLKAETEAAIARLKPLDDDADDAAVDRRARTITNIARAAKAAAGLTATGRRPTSAATEDDMAEKDIDDIDPDELARLRAELESRLEHVARIVEQKRMAGWAGSGTNPVGARTPAEAALAPGSAAA